MSDAFTELEQARAALDDFCAANAHVINNLKALAQHYNESLKTAEDLVRSSGRAGAGFKVTTKTYIKSQELWQAIGTQRFLACGGKLETVTSAAIEKTAIARAAASSMISEQEAGVGMVQGLSVTKPGPYLVLP